jgi:subtilisin family serine protease
MMKTVHAWLLLGISGLIPFLAGCPPPPPMTVTPNDPRYTEQWGYGNIGMPVVWTTTSAQPGNPVTVAVIDTGIYAGGHPDLPPRSANNARFLESGADIAVGTDTADLPQNCDHHGTHVSGTILATTNNGQGVAGMLWTQDSLETVNHLSVRSLGCDGSGTLEDVIQGVYYAAGIPNRYGLSLDQPAAVINMSLGGAGYCSASFEAAIQAAVAAGSVVVVAAGNNGDETPQQPASCPSVTFTVGATNPDNQLVTFSSYGFNDLSAPGITILSTYRDPDYDKSSGTSMATPHVSGAAAVLLQRNAGLTVAQIQALLVNNAQSFDDERMGAGILRVPNAFASATEPELADAPRLNSNDRVANPGEMNPAADFVPGEILVLYTQPARAAETTARILGQNADIQAVSENPNIPVLLRLAGPEVGTMGEVQLKQETLEQINQLIQSPDVIYAEPNYILRAINN